MALTFAQLKPLADFLLSPQRPEKTLNLEELCGFLFAVASAPEWIDESEWLPLIFNSSSANYEGEQQAQMEALIRQLHGELMVQVENAQVVLPEWCTPHAVAMENFSDDSAFSAWCRGYMGGHDWLDELWEEYLPDDVRDEFASIMVILSFFASRELADAYYGDLAENSRSFEETAQQVLALHADAMKEYSRIGNTILQAIERIKAEKPEPATSHKVGRNEPCPCGSGKKYKKCCGQEV